MHSDPKKKHSEVRIEHLLQAVLQTVDILLTTSNHNEALQVVLQKVGLIIGADSVALFEAQDGQSGCWLLPRANWTRESGFGKHTRNVHCLTRIADWHAAFQRGECLTLTSHHTTVSGRAFLRRQQARAMLAVPVMLSDRYWGVLTIGDTEGERAWKQHEIACLQTLARVISHAVTQQRLEEELLLRESSLRMSETRYLGLINDQVEMAYRCAPDLRLTFVNDACCRFWGRTHEELLEAPLLPLLPEEEQTALRQKFEQLSPAHPMTSYVFAMTATDGMGSRTQWHTRAFFNDSGVLVEYQSVGRDVSDRLSIEAQMDAREARYRAIVANAAMGICLIDRFGQFLECNPAFVRMTGYSPVELAMNALAQVTQEEDWQREQQLLKRLWHGQERAYQLEKRLVNSEGQRPWVHTYATLIEDDAGSPQYVMQMVEDISLRKEAERLRTEYEEKFRALTLNATLTEEGERRRIAQNLHDHIGQSLAIARLQLGNLCLAEHNMPTQMRAQIDEIRDLLREALDFSRTVTSELSSPVLHELGLIPGLRWLARHFSERYHLPTELLIETDLPDFSPTLRVVVYSIIRELLYNVVKHAQATAANIAFTSDGDAVTISVNDNGRGMTEERHEDGHTGFGLFSIRERVEQLGGSFYIRSASGHGADCLLILPMSVLGTS